MDAKESLIIVLEALQELKKQKVTKQALIDCIRGIESRVVKEAGLDSAESFGQGDKREEPHFNAVIEQAINEKLLKVTDNIISTTPKGDKFRKNPTSFILTEENEKEPEEKDEAMLDDLVKTALNNKDEEEDAEDISIPPTSTTAKSQQLIHLLQAIDRKIPLDDYAEQMQLGFDEILELLEQLIQRGTKFDISYFVDQVLEKECQDEMLDYLDEVDGDVERAIEEFYGVYQPEEIRLVSLIWK